MKKNKSLAVGMALCFVAVIALTGFWLFRETEGIVQEPQEQEKLAEEEQDDESPIAPTQSMTVEKEEGPEEKTKEPEEPVEETEGNIRKLDFSKKSELLWPVDGFVIINYSMDRTVYFTTLDQYKYNPAVIISGDMGAEVIASASGIVTDVTETAETGLTVTMELGNGYEAVYGQLMEVAVSPGEYIENGKIIGKIAEPTKYYSVEGSNLYFQLLLDGEPVNPMDYFEE